VLKAGVEKWTPSSTGAFLYQFDGGLPPIYFPVSNSEGAQPRRRSVFGRAAALKSPKEVAV
jgi:hypothetical protein